MCTAANATIAICSGRGLFVMGADNRAVGASVVTGNHLRAREQHEKDRRQAKRSSPETHT